MWALSLANSYLLSVSLNFNCPRSFILFYNGNTFIPFGFRSAAIIEQTGRLEK